MLPEQWDTFKRAARLEKMDKIPMALIVDSPWIPGYLGIKHMDYYLDPELWFQSNLKIIQEFPDIIFVPSWWMEYGMAAEPSILGAKIKFWQDNTPSEYHTLYRLEDIDEFPEYEVEADAFAAMTLHRIGMHKQRILNQGYILPMVTSRGPLCTAGFVRSTTNLMVELVDEKAGQLGLKNVRGVVRDFVSDGTGLADASQMHAMIFNLLHIEDPLALLAEVRRIVKPNGSASVIHWRSDVPTPRGPPQEIRPSPQQCRDWLQEAGFSTVTTIDVADACPYHFALLAR